MEVLVPPSPKFQDHELIAPVEMSVNNTSSGASPSSGETKRVGGGIIKLMVFEVSFEKSNVVLVTFRKTEYCPGVVKICVIFR